jgi:hypothetical protein
MPLLRYLTFVGGTLLALLFVASWYFPETETIKHSDVAKPVIRITSDRVGPPRVDFDTRVEAAAIPVPAPDPELVADNLEQAPARVAEARPVAQTTTPTVAVKIEHKKTKVAKRTAPQRVAANPQGFQPFRSAWWRL